MIRTPALLAPALVLMLVLAGCAVEDGLRPYVLVRRADVWQAVIKDQDRSRLARLYEAWDEAAADIAQAGKTSDLAALGPVGQSGVAETQSFPAAGAHECRTILLGWRQGMPRISPPVQVGAWAPCRLGSDGVLLRLETAAGPQQYFGALYPDVARLIFLGSVRLAGEAGRLRYGEDQARDQLGVLHAIGPGHWRIALPWPQWTARLALIDIRAVPA